MTIYGRPFSEVPQSVIDETRERLARLQSREPLASIVVIGYNGDAFAGLPMGHQRDTV